MNNRRQLLNNATQRLAQAGATDAALDAQWLLAQALDLPRLQMLLDMDAPVAPAAQARFETWLAQREGGMPLQYVLGEAPFMGHDFYVTPSVLIPRADTEVLCEAAIERLSDGGAMVDIGTGSGAIAVSVALACPDAEITAVDISGDALAIARENAKRLGANVRFYRSDLLDDLPPRTFNVIVSNPPYIPSADLPSLQWEVRAEPQLALDGGADGLAFYRRIVDGLPNRLMPGGSLLLEVGDGQAGDVSALLAGHFQSIQVRRDHSGLCRAVIGDRYAG